MSVMLEHSRKFVLDFFGVRRHAGVIGWLAEAQELDPPDIRRGVLAQRGSKPRQRRSADEVIFLDSANAWRPALRRVSGCAFYFVLIQGGARYCDGDIVREVCPEVIVGVVKREFMV
jgi:hypothetical protein